MKSQTAALGQFLYSWSVLTVDGMMHRMRVKLGCHLLHLRLLWSDPLSGVLKFKMQTKPTL